MDDSARSLATEKLISIFANAPTGSAQQLEAIAALGRAGGVEATQKIIAIYAKAPTNSALQLAAIKALGEAGRLETA